LLVFISAVYFKLSDQQVNLGDGCVILV